MSRGIGRGQRCIWDDCANLLTRSCEEIRRIITLVVFQTLLCCDDGRRLWWKATSRQLERGFHSTRYRDPLMTRNDCSRVNRRRTRHARKINCSFLPSFFLSSLPPPLLVAQAPSLRDRELQMNSMIEAPRDLLCIVIAQAISRLLLIAEGIDYNGFTCAALMQRLLHYLWYTVRITTAAITRGFIRYRCIY